MKNMHLHSSEGPWRGGALEDSLGPSTRPLDAAQATHVALWIRIGLSANEIVTVSKLSV